MTARPKCTAMAGNSGDNDSDVVTIEADAGQVITGLCIKSGENSFGDKQHSDVITADGTYGECFVVEGVGTDEVTITAEEGCHIVSHVDYTQGPPASVPPAYPRPCRPVFRRACRPVFRRACRPVFRRACRPACRRACRPPPRQRGRRRSRWQPAIGRCHAEHGNAAGFGWQRAHDPGSAVDPFAGGIRLPEHRQGSPYPRRQLISQPA